MSGTSSAAVPPVSVLTVVFNGEEFIADCIESVLAQSFDDFEYVISDNHSTDGTDRILARYAAADQRVRIVRPVRFVPPNRHRNFLVSQSASGSRYVKFVDADDELMPDCIEAMVDVAERYPSAGMVGAMRFAGAGIDLDGIPPGVDLVRGSWLLRNQLRGAPYTTGSPTSSLMRRSAVFVGSASFYDESYVHCDDALAYRILCHSDFGFVHRPLTRTRRHEESLTRWSDRIGTHAPERLRMALEFGPGVLTPSELDVVVNRLERTYASQLTRGAASLRLIREREAIGYHRGALSLITRICESSGRRVSLGLTVWARLLAARSLGNVTTQT